MRCSGRGSGYRGGGGQRLWGGAAGGGGGRCGGGGERCSAVGGGVCGDLGVRCNPGWGGGGERCVGGVQGERGWVATGCGGGGREFGERRAEGLRGGARGWVAAHGREGRGAVRGGRWVRVCRPPPPALPGRLQSWGGGVCMGWGAQGGCQGWGGGCGPTEERSVPQFPPVQSSGLSPWRVQLGGGGTSPAWPPPPRVELHGGAAPMERVGPSSDPHPGSPGTLESPPPPPGHGGPRSPQFPRAQGIPGAPQPAPTPQFSGPTPPAQHLPRAPAGSGLACGRSQRRRHHGQHLWEPAEEPDRKEGDADPDGGAGRRREDHHPLQAEAGGDRHHHPHHRCAKREGGGAGQGPLTIRAP